jgi:hypothetical protein
MLGLANLTHGRESFYCKENRARFYEGLKGFTCPYSAKQVILRGHVKQFLSDYEETLAAT